LSFTITTNKYTLPDARVEFTWSQLADVAATVPGATCTNTPSGHSCALGTLAPNSSIPLTLRLRGAAKPVGTLNAQLISPAETNPRNNLAFVHFRIYEPGDAAIAMPQANTIVTVGQRAEFRFDLNVIAEVNEVTLELEFDQSRLANPWAGGICSSTASGMRCDLGLTQPAATMHHILTFWPEGVGTTPITVRVRSTNDTNPANDTQTATITINAAPQPPAPPPPPPPASFQGGGGGGGGGGPMGWPLLAGLALLASVHQLLRRHARVRFAQR
jgi:hypothetical protein